MSFFNVVLMMYCPGFAHSGKKHRVYSKHPIFHIMIISAASVTSLFRANPKSSIEEELYSATDNPNPVMELVYDLYGISANGVITVWVNDDVELKFLRRPLKVG